MDAEDVVVLILIAVFVGFVVWLAIHTRRHPAGEDRGAAKPMETTGHPPGVETQQRDVVTKKS